MSTRMEMGTWVFITFEKLFVYIHFLSHYFHYSLHKDTKHLKVRHSQFARVVILGIRRLTGKYNGRAGVLAHYAGHKLGILDIFS
jgi:hypothetical protein